MSEDTNDEELRMIPRSPISEEELDARLDRFAEWAGSIPAEGVLDWFDSEASDLLDALWTVCGERLDETEWDAMFALLPRIYALIVPKDLERYEIDVERLAAGFQAWEEELPAKPASADFDDSRQPLIVDDALALLEELTSQENLLKGPSRKIAVALLAATVDELDCTVIESMEKE